jgi:hypothetical protein
VNFLLDSLMAIMGVVITVQGLLPGSTFSKNKSGTVLWEPQWLGRLIGLMVGLSLLGFSLFNFWRDFRH